MTKRKKFSSDGNRDDFTGGYLVYPYLLFNCNDIEKP